MKNNNLKYGRSPVISHPPLSHSRRSGVFIVNLKFTDCFGVSIDDVRQINTGWVG